jgi:hypothetical protein
VTISRQSARSSHFRASASYSDPRPVTERKVDCISARRGFLTAVNGGSALLAHAEVPVLLPAEAATYARRACADLTADRAGSILTTVSAPEHAVVQVVHTEPTRAFVHHIRQDAFVQNVQ